MDQTKTPHRGLYDASERCMPALPEVKSERVALEFQGGHLEFYVQDMGLGPELNMVLSHCDGTIENRTRVKTTPALLVELGHMLLEYTSPFKKAAIAHDTDLEDRLQEMGFQVADPSTALELIREDCLSIPAPGEDSPDGS